MRYTHTAVLMIAALCTGCATNPLASLPKHAPVDATELQRKVDAVLDYETGKANALPSDLFSVSPLAEKGKDEASEIQKMADDMRQRHAEIQSLRAQHVLGEDNRGYLTLRNDDSFATAAEKNAMQKLMAAENDCRKAVYRGIAQASEEKGLTLTRVERAFSARRLARSESGGFMQLPSNDDEYAAFQKTPLGQKLGQSVHPGDWVEIP